MLPRRVLIPTGPSSGNPNNSEQPRTPSGSSVPTLDRIAEDLQRLRADNGCVSYQEIVSRITKAREAKGMAPAVARIARTTVYDCFRTGRTRINPELVGEIVSVLTSDDEQAEQWVQRCKTAQTNGGKSSAKERERQEITWSLPDPRPRSFWFNLLVTLACVWANLLFAFWTRYFFKDHFPLYVDMIGVAVVAMVLSTRWGVVAAVMSQVFGLLWGPSSWHNFMFVFVAVAGALVWGLGIHRFHMARSFLRYIGLNVIAGIVCSMVAIPVLLIFFGGSMEMLSSQSMADALMAAGRQFVVSMFSANLVVSLADKLLAGIVALILAGTVFKRYAPTDLVALTMTPGQRSQILNRQISE